MENDNTLKYLLYIFMVVVVIVVAYYGVEIGNYNNTENTVMPIVEQLWNGERKINS